MFSAMLFAISFVALAQFALYYWRAVVAGVAAQPISQDVLAAVQLQGSELCGGDFQRLASLLTLTPELKAAALGWGLCRPISISLASCRTCSAKCLPRWLAGANTNAFFARGMRRCK